MNKSVKRKFLFENKWILFHIKQYGIPSIKNYLIVHAWDGLEYTIFARQIVPMDLSSESLLD